MGINAIIAITVGVASATLALAAALIVRYLMGYSATTTIAAAAASVCLVANILRLAPLSAALSFLMICLGIACVIITIRGTPKTVPPRPWFTTMALTSSALLSQGLCFWAYTGSVGNTYVVGGLITLAVIELLLGGSLAGQLLVRARSVLRATQ